jgi:flavin prenyltransferase
MEQEIRKIIVAVTGASGQVYAKHLLRKLRELDPPISETAVVFSENARKVWDYEIGAAFAASGKEKLYGNNDLFAPFASGSSRYDTMIICPASMGTIGRIAGGTSGDLIARSADVILKEKRKLILVPRETPYNLIHIRNLETLTLAGGIICPASPSFYSRPGTVEELIMTVVDRILSLAGFFPDTFRWMEND